MRSGLHDPAFYSEMWNTITSGQVWRGRIVNRKRNGELYEQFSTIAPVRDEQGTITHFVAVQLDLSREVALEKQLRQAERLTAIGQTITGVAHHLKNILARLEGSAAQIAEHFERGQFDELRSLWGIYQRSTERLSSLARTMLDYARLDKLALESSEIGSLVRDICEQCAPGAHARGVAVHWKIPADLPPLVCDPLRMHDAILNLIGNAIEVCGEVGLGCVQVRVCHDGPARVLRIEIEDDGPGVPEELQSRIFDPFFTTKADGTGLGLAMARKIIMEHGGLLELESLPGRTCFRVTFSL
jgi:signal transduction histidine kinase